MKLKKIFAIMLLLLILFFSVSCRKKEEPLKVKLNQEQIEKIIEIQEMIKLSDRILAKEITNRKKVEEVVEYFKDEEVMKFLANQGLYHAIDRTVKFIEQEYLKEKK